MDLEKIQKIWKVLKQVIEIILAGIGGLVAGHVATSCIPFL